MKILTGTKVSSITDDGAQVTVARARDGATQELKADSRCRPYRVSAPKYHRYGLIGVADRPRVPGNGMEWMEWNGMEWNGMD